MLKIKTIIVLLVPFLGSCGLLQKIPSEGVHYIVKDSTVFNIRDSIRVIPTEKVEKMSFPYQVSKIETSLAQSTAYTDTTGLLHHTIENKKGAEYREKTIYKYKEHRDTLWKTEYRDKIVEKPVKFVPKVYKWSLWVSIFFIIVFILKIYLKIRRPL